MHRLITGHHPLDLPPIPFELDGAQVSLTRKGPDAIAKEHAVERLVETAKVILNLMPIAENRALHARLRSDIEALQRYGLGEQA
ncbi:MAG: hypothetical protein GAK28_00593 [Luteibacter sp.]|uniref:hypothetical protein n=1 Tax=Luteibacter sp. TaxID=1886636 RepID=UPI0013858415|nr:hypothetical protein [Luteibacter sp.]KAF1008961.1 MAG: hypothetical protein GAK28_00593 [Luteibacter sp.]